MAIKLDKSIWLVLLLAGGLGLRAGPPTPENALMHCFVFTPLDQASDADWEAFYEATGELPRQIEGLHRAWAGKLRQARTQFVPNENGEFLSRRREYGVCMELADEAALGYYADHAAHRAWEQVYERVREPATFTFDIVGP